MAAEKIKGCAEFMLGKGYSVIPIDPSSKKPAIKWKENIDAPLKSWEYQGCNMAILTGEYNGIVVVDCDSYDSYVGWLKHMPPTPLRVRTGRGMHFYYRFPGAYVKSDSHIEHPEGFEYDVKGSRSYVLFPPSIKDGHQYQFCVCSGNLRGSLMNFNDLPVFDMAWRPERESSYSNAEDEKKICDAVAYISRIESVQGRGGDKDCFRAACRLAESNLSKLEAYEAFLAWNQTNAKPPWEPSELRRKLEAAWSSVRPLSVTMQLE